MPFLRPSRLVSFAMARRAPASSHRRAPYFGIGGPPLHPLITSTTPRSNTEQIGTDPSVGLSTERGTGTYRVPSLRDVGDRTPLLATGAVRDVTELLDPARTAPGHDHKRDLGAEDRAALVRFLETL